ncbi:hypothetical protein Tco_0578849 [Tanacetum coccineum]
MMENQIRFYKRSGSCGRNNKQQQEDNLSNNKKDKCLIAESYYWDEEELSSGDDEIIFMKAFMAVKSTRKDLLAATLDRCLVNKYYMVFNLEEKTGIFQPRKFVKFMDDFVVEEIYFTSRVMVGAEDLGQKRIHDSDETAMVLGSQGKSNEIGIAHKTSHPGAFPLNKEARLLISNPKNSWLSNQQSKEPMALLDIWQGLNNTKKSGLKAIFGDNLL